MLTIHSKSHDYTVDEFDGLRAALESTPNASKTFYLVDAQVAELYRADFEGILVPERTIQIDATEEQKSYENLTPIFFGLLEKKLKRDMTLVVVGGGVMQDIGCFIASVLFRGLRWELIPTTLLAQADSCIGSKSSLNIGPYKNQIGTFYPPNRVLLTREVLSTLPWDEIRSGLGEVIKLQLLTSDEGFQELMADLAQLKQRPEVLSKWVNRSLAVKHPYIEADEYDRGIRNLLNYGHTFGHAYESATHFGIPHGISVILGMLTATFLSAKLGLVPVAYYEELKNQLAPWHQPYGGVLKQASLEGILSAIKHDKKNTGDTIQCILTRGPGVMEKRPVAFEQELAPAIREFIEQQLS